MKKCSILILLLFAITTYAQDTSKPFKKVSHKILTDQLPPISADSTEAELRAHVVAMMDWMEKQHFEYNFSNALIYADTGLYLAEKTNDIELIHRTRSIIGNMMVRIKDTTRARKLFLKSLKEAEKAKDSAAIISVSNNLANAYYYTGNLNHKAVAMYINGAKVAENINDHKRAFVLNHNAARIFIEDGNVEKTREYVEKSAKFLSAIDNPYFTSGHLRNEGMLYVLLKQPDEAIKRFKKNIAIAKELNFMDGLIDGYEGYIQALEQKEDYKKLYEISQELKEYKDKQEADEKNQAIEVVTAKINIERYKEQIKNKELEKELAEQEADRNSAILYSFIAITIALGTLLFIIFNSIKKREKLVEDLKEKNRQYLEAKEKSEALSKSKSKFFSTVSHELRTPLYGIIGISSFLLDDNKIKHHKEDLKSLKFSADYLLSMINDVLEVNKLDSTKDISLEKEPFNIRELVENIIHSFEFMRAQNNNLIQVLIDNRVPQYVLGDSTKLSQILINLIGNACKFTQDGIVVLKIDPLEITASKAQLQFIIKDTGIGISEEKQQHIFDEFTQDYHKNEYAGTGLGLSIVKRLVALHNSEIELESKVGKGSTFKFKLTYEIVDAEKIKNKKPEHKEVDILKDKKILIVDDNRVNQIVTAKILEKYHINCSTASNGKEAIDKFKQYHYDLILMDINMPIMNGFEATEIIRKENSEIPILALTAVELEELERDIFNYGMNDIVVKPYDLESFIKKLSHHLK